ncbi:permease [bacterium]|jgi:uncharacterized protein|nr:permease [bacterium]
MDQLLIQAALRFVHLTMHVYPTFIVGVVFGAVLQVVVHPETVLRVMGKGWQSILRAAIFGGITPSCSCSSIPIAESMGKRGASIGALGSFLFVSPVLGPHTIVLTYVVLGQEFLIARVIAGLVGAVLFGLVLDRVFVDVDVAALLGGTDKPTKSCCAGDDSCSSNQNGSSWVDKIKEIGTESWSMIKRFSFYLFLGLMISALLDTLVPANTLQSLIKGDGVLSYLLSLGIGLPVYMSAGEEIVVTNSLLGLGLAKGPAMTFLLVSVGTCIPTIMMFRKMLGQKAATFYTVWWIGFSLVAGIVYQLAGAG